MEHRWVYVGPNSNYARKCWRDAVTVGGFEPRLADEHTYAQNVPWLPEHAPQAHSADRYIRSGDMILMHRPKEIGRKRDAYFRKQTLERTAQLEVNLQEDAGVGRGVAPVERELVEDTSTGRRDAPLNLGNNRRVPPTGY